MSEPASFGARAGTTLVELLIAVGIAGVIAAVSSVAFRAGLPTTPVDALTAPRDSAIWSGRAVPASGALVGDSSRVILFLPDGRAIGPGVNPLTGRRSHDAR